MLPSRQQVLLMNLVELRPVVQSYLDAPDWPGDWEAVGMILGKGYFNFQRTRGGQELFGITLFGERVNGTGIDENPLVCVFRAYALMHLEEAELGGGEKKEI